MSQQMHSKSQTVQKPLSAEFTAIRLHTTVQLPRRQTNRIQMLKKGAQLNTNPAQFIVRNISNAHITIYKSRDMVFMILISKAIPKAHVPMSVIYR